MRFIILFSNWRHLFPWYWTLFSKAKDVEDNICTHFIFFWGLAALNIIYKHFKWSLVIHTSRTASWQYSSHAITGDFTMSLFNSVMEHIKSTRLFIFCINWCCSCKPSKLIFWHFYEWICRPPILLLHVNITKRHITSFKKCTYKPQSELTK